MPAEILRIQLRKARISLDDERDALRGERACADPAALGDRTKQGALCDSGCFEPDLDRLDRAQLGATRYGDALSSPFLVGLAAANMDDQAVRRPLKIAVI